MKTLFFSLFSLLILASCTVDTVSQDELLQQELLSLSEASKGSTVSGSYEDDDDSYEDEGSENENSSSDNDSSDNDSSDEDSSNDSDSDSSQNTQGFSATVLTNIQTYVNTNHSGQTIIKMEQETNYIEVDLSNGIEIYFDNNGNFMRYDN